MKKEDVLKVIDLNLPEALDLMFYDASVLDVKPLVTAIEQSINDFVIEYVLKNDCDDRMYCAIKDEFGGYMNKYIDYKYYDIDLEKYDLQDTLIGNVIEIDRMIEED